MVHRMIGGLLAAACLFVIPAMGLAAAPQPLEVGQPLARFDLIKPGVHRYARYMIKGDQRSLMDLWTRQVSFEQEKGKRVLRIRQRWDAADKSYVAVFDQTFEAGTFRPLGQSQTVT